MSSQSVNLRVHPSLAETLDHPPMPPDEVAQRWGVSTGTLANWRSAGKGPAFIKLGGGIVRYRLEDVLAFEHAGLVAP